MSDDELERLAADFWSGTRLDDHSPRDVETAIALKLPVTVVKLPVVTVSAAGTWLRGRCVVPELPCCGRDLRGFLFAVGGQGFIFVCGADSAEEQRFTLAHDAAHFLVDYWRPRQQVIETLGDAVVEVLDGRRPATLDERMSAVLARVRVGPHWHLLPRRDPDDRVARAEDRADDLGLELVAPRRLAQRMMRDGADAVALGVHFGLPHYVFGPLVAAHRRASRPSFIDDVRTLLGRGP